MIKVILYGISYLESRLKIEGALDDDAVLIGYMDSYWIENIARGGGNPEFEYLPVIRLEELNSIEYDFIVINVFKNKHIEQITKSLLENGVNIEKIIPFYWFSFVGLCNSLDKYFRIQNKKFSGLLLGMSYALDGFYNFCFRERFFNFAARGMDLYYHYHVLQRVFAYIGSQEELYNDLKYIVLELPYFILNYDVSKEMRLFRYRISSMNVLQQWHHALEAEAGINYKKQWEGYVRLFEQKLGRQESLLTSCSYSNVIRRQSETQEKSYDAFFSPHKETVEENIKILGDIFNLVYQFKPEIKLSVVVFPFSDRCQEWKEVDYQKRQFYKILNQIKKQYPDFLIFDYYNLFDDHREYFYDYAHLNVEGAKIFSRFLNEEFEKTLYI